MIKLERKHGQAICPAECEEMFQYYCETQSASEVARKFKHSKSTIFRIMKRQNWRGRFKTVHKKMIEKLNRKAEQTIVSNLKLATALKNKVLAELLEKHSIIEPTVSDAVRIMAYEDALKGNMPKQKQGDNIVNIVSYGKDSEDGFRLDETAEICGFARKKDRF